MGNVINLKYIGSAMTSQDVHYRIERASSFSNPQFHYDIKDSYHLIFHGIYMNVFPTEITKSD